MAFYLPHHPLTHNLAASFTDSPLERIFERQKLSTMIEVSNTQYNLVYNVISFTLASMAATTIFVWMRVVSGLTMK